MPVSRARPWAVSNLLCPCLVSTFFPLDMLGGMYKIYKYGFGEVFGLSQSLKSFYLDIISNLQKESLHTLTQISVMLTPHRICFTFLSAIPPSPLPHLFFSLSLSLDIKIHIIIYIYIFYV